MILRFTMIAGVALAVTTPSHAQQQTPDAASLRVAPIETTAEAKALIGAPLDTSASGTSGEPEGDVGPLFVITENTVKPAAEWSAEDSAACKAAGGVELPISAGRIACINL